MVAAGAVVTSHVPAHALVRGVPARATGGFVAAATSLPQKPALNARSVVGRSRSECASRDERDPDAERRATESVPPGEVAIAPQSWVAGSAAV